MLTGLMQYKIVKEFKADKRRDYISIVRQISSLEGAQLQTIQQFWNNIYDYQHSTT